jgi:hypothetical protein
VMLRRNDIAKILVIGLLSTPVAMTAQTSFDEHFAFAKQGKLGEREAAFTKNCGVDRASSMVTHGRSLDENWTFKHVSSVGNGRDDAEMDFLGNAEIWSVGGKPRFLNVWFLIMDTGNSNNEMFCVDQDGHVLMQESLNVYEPVDGSKGGWRRLRVVSYPGTAKAHVLKNVFLNEAGAQITAPQLSKDDLEESNGHSSPDLAKDLIVKVSQRK